MAATQKAGGESLKLSTFNDIFNEPSPQQASTIRKLRSLPKNDQNELFNKLQKQRLHVNENAIHFVAEAREQSRADARNSVFKLANRFRAMPDKETIMKIKKVFGRVGGLDEDSGDEEWEPSYKRLPDSLKTKAKEKLMERMNKSGKEALLDEMDNLEKESQNLVGVVTQEVIEEPVQPQAQLIQQLDELKVETGEDDDDDDVDFDDEDFRRLNTLQKEFMGNNLEDWYKDIATAYSSGVKVVKVNAMGQKFIRTLKVDGLYLSITQPHTKSSVRVDREVSLFEIGAVELGKESREFAALEQAAKAEKDDATTPHPTQCAVVRLPGGRSLSLIFLEEEQRNGFVFFLRVTIKRAKAARADVEMGC